MSNLNILYALHKHACIHSTPLIRQPIPKLKKKGLIYYTLIFLNVPGGKSAYPIKLQVWWSYLGWDGQKIQEATQFI